MYVSDCNQNYVTTDVKIPYVTYVNSLSYL